MIKINKKVEYALIALKHIASLSKNGPVSAREICDIYQTPFDTTAKILQILNSHKILSSTQGSRGGYVLSTSLKNLNFVDLVEMVERKPFYLTCIGSKGLCELHSSCNIKTPLEALNFKLKQFFDTLNVHELLLIDEQVICPGEILFKQGANS